MLEKLIRTIAFNHHRPHQFCGQADVAGEKVRCRIARPAASLFDQAQPDVAKEGTA